MRKTRKDEHLMNYLKTEYQGDNLLDNIYLEHEALSELNFEDIDTTIDLFGKKVKFPLIINAMTGGTEMSESINADLSLLAEKYNLPMAVGSQQIALDDEEARESFEVIKESLSDENIIIANLSARASLDEMERAVDMIRADAIGLHLNSCQELVMTEGERDFKGIIDNISQAQKRFGDRLLVKEVGYGMRAETVKHLYDLGVKNIDISGHGGTNFTEIEDMRDYQADFEDLYNWGIPTAKAIINARSISDDLNIIGAGGIKKASDIVKSLVIGANCTAMSGELLKYLLHGDFDYACLFVESLIYKTKIMMLMLGAKEIKDLKKVPYKTFGKLREILD